MSVHQGWIEGTANDGQAPLARRVIATVGSAITGIIRRVVDEEVYMIREDYRNGQISRELEDWER